VRHVVNWRVEPLPLRVKLRGMRKLLVVLCLVSVGFGCSSNSPSHGATNAGTTAANGGTHAGTAGASGSAHAGASGSTQAGSGSAHNDAGTKPPDSGNPRDAETDSATQMGADAGSSSNADAGSPMLGPVQTPGDPGSADVMIEVHADMDMHAISPLIYGMNTTDDIAKNHQSVVRSGGNRMTAYNWENNASNAGSDYMFQNDNLLSTSSDPAKPILDLLTTTTMNGAAALVTVPIVDYVSADETPGGDVRNSGSNYLMTRFKQNKPAKGSAFAATPDTSDAFVYEDEFVAFLKAHQPKANVFFSLDNEPDLWSSTHAEIHPTPVTYAELWDRSQRFSIAIKAAWPGAAVLGPVSYGWAGYTSLQSATDANGRDFLEWYLDQAKAADAKSGRLIDYLDLHWYPEAQGSSGTRITDKSSAPDVVAAREQAPRSLWDTTYNEKSWIHDDSLKAPIQLVPRMLGKIAMHYPGTRLSFSEWNFGGGMDISGAIASADVLGVYGREGVSFATQWPSADGDSFTYAAFRAFRSYDGSGASFGDISVRATTSDVANVTVYGSFHASATDNVVLVAINKATTDKTVGIRLSHPTLFGALKVYQLAGTTAELAGKPDQASAAKNAWKLTLPAQSVSVLVPQH
jgi:hypothetical protein